jgi:hypothetical protein
VIHGRITSTRAKVLFGVLSLLAAVSASSQAPQVTAQPRTVPLVSDTCPSVRIGDSVSLDLNPLFDPIWPVTGLRGFALTFAPVAEDGVHLKRGELSLRTGNTPLSISPLGNGFFHLELTVSMKRIQPGTYRLIRANATAEVVPDYAGEPQMTRSPVEERYCITVVAPQNPQSPQSGS